MTVNYDTYAADKKRFFAKHRHDFRADTSAMDQYSSYSKTYVFSDGARWYEVFRPVWRTFSADAIADGVTVTLTQDVKLFETEYFNSEDANSNFYYERY